MPSNKKRNILLGLVSLLIVIRCTNLGLAGWMDFVLLCGLIMLMAAPRLTIAWAFLKKSRQAKDLSAKRTSETTATIVGMASFGFLTSEGIQAAPLAEFEANGNTHYASITCMQIRPKAVDEPTWGKNLTMFIPMRYYNDFAGFATAYSQDLLSSQQRISDFRTKELSCSDISDWNRMRYEESIVSKLLPVGTEVRVTYDPENPTNNEIVPYGEDTPSTTRNMVVFVGGIFVLLVIFYSIWCYAIS